MIMSRAYIFRLEGDGQTLNIFETAERQRVEFICDSGHFCLSAEEATKIAQLIDPNSYASERIRYRPDPNPADYGKSYDETAEKEGKR